MPSMPMRVAMIASECEPWAKTGGLADVVDALARALGVVAGSSIETPVDVFLPRYRGVPVPDPSRVERTSVLRVPDPLSPSGNSAGDHHRRRGGRLPAPTGRPSGRVRSRGLLRRRGRRLTPTTRGASGCSAGPRWRRSAPTGSRSTSSTSTTGTPGRRRSSATTATRTIRSSAARPSSSPCTTSPITAGRRGPISASSA